MSMSCSSVKNLTQKTKKLNNLKDYEVIPYDFRNKCNPNVFNYRSRTIATLHGFIHGTSLVVAVG